MWHDVTTNTLVYETPRQADLLRALPQARAFTIHDVEDLRLEFEAFGL